MLGEIWPPLAAPAAPHAERSGVMLLRKKKRTAPTAECVATTSPRSQYCYCLSFHASPSRNKHFRTGETRIRSGTQQKRQQKRQRKRQREKQRRTKENTIVRRKRNRDALKQQQQPHHQPRSKSLMFSSLVGFSTPKAAPKSWVSVHRRPHDATG